MCSLSKFYTARKLHPLGRFTWFKKPVLLIQALTSTSTDNWKDLMHLSTWNLPQTLPLKSTTLPQLTVVWIKSYQILVEMKILRRKINFCEDRETCEILKSNFAPLTCIENLKNLEGFESPLELSIPDQLSYSESIRIWEFCYATENQLGF